MRLRDQPVENQGGIAMIAMLLILLPLVTIAVVSIATLSGRTSATIALASGERSRLAAESGLEVAFHRALQGALVTGTAQVGTLGIGESYSFVAQDMATDGTDNDGDTAIDESDELGYSVVSTGTHTTSTRKLQAWFGKPVTLPTLESALRIHDPGALITVSTSSFAIDGNDYLINGSPGAGAALPGLSLTLPASPAVVIAGIPLPQQVGITGTGAAPSIVVTSTVMDIPRLVSGLAVIAEQSLFGGTYATLTNLGTATPNGWRVTCVNGTATLTGSNSGAGVLVVDGHLTISGSLTFTGFVLVTGNVTVATTSSNLSVRGAMLILGDPGVGSSLTVEGALSVQQSSEALTAIQSKLAQWSFLGLRELSRY